MYALIICINVAVGVTCIPQVWDMHSKEECEKQQQIVQKQLAYNSKHYEYIICAKKH